MNAVEACPLSPLRWMTPALCLLVAACSDAPPDSEKTASPSPPPVEPSPPLVVATPEPRVVMWNDFIRNFIDQGRVVDTGNGGVSHSEGQGYGMLLAESHGDRPIFDQLWEWTKANLGKREDRLFCWKWAPAADGNGGAVTDPNNASDGDILIAWALLRASERWQEPAYAQAADAVLADLLALCTKLHANRLLLLPGAEGFDHGEKVVVNLSYWIYPALRDFHARSSDDRWLALFDVGLELTRLARFSPRKLPPDWLSVLPTGLDIADGWPPEYGYNAVRIPMHLIWANISTEPYLQSFRLLAETVPDLAAIPATVNLATGQPGPTPVLPGMAAIYRLALHPAQFRGGTLPYPAMQADESYFSASLGLLCNLASAEEERFPPPEASASP